MVRNLITSLIRYIIKLIWKITPRIVEKRQLNITKEDLKATEDLSLILKGRNDGQTITNILDWQEQNIDYWFERSESYIAVYLAVIATLFLVYMLGIISTPATFGIFTFLITIYLILLVRGSNTAFLALILVLYIVEILYVLVTCGKNLPLFYIGFGFFIGVILSILVEKLLIYRHFTNKKSSSSRITYIIEMLKLTFEIKLPIKKLLDYKSAICRDYAILGSTLLINSKIKSYYVVIPLHAATAIKINDEFYVIDQRLPIRQLDKWLSSNNENVCRIYKTSFKENSEKADIEFVQKYNIKDSKKPYPVNIDKLENDVTSYFGLSKNKNGDRYIDLDIGDKAPFFYNEVTHLSIVRMIITSIEKQFCSNVSKILYVEIKENNQNLIATVYY